MEKKVFSFIDYKAYLRAVEQQGDYKGFRSRIAEQTNCQNAFVSQVLNGQVNFNLEQALRIASFLELKGDRIQYFLWMVELKRAGTPELKSYFQNLMDLLRQKNLDIKERVQIPQALSKDAQSTYYSNWIYAAVHIIAMIPNLNSVSKIAKALDFKDETIHSVVEFLVTNGLIEKQGPHLVSGSIQIHVSQDSANISKHHTNWRIEAIKSLDQPSKTDLHYSGVSSISKNDIDKIRSMFVETIESYVRIVESSPEETLYTFNLDFFKVLKNEKQGLAVNWWALAN